MASSYPSPVSLPSPSREDLRSNPHPYAIKTTSTGVLSRSNSTRSSASASHHFVPSSPTQHKSARSRPNSHRYSTSLNSNDLPRPLPVPPSFPSSPSPSPSPTKPGFDFPDDAPALHRTRDRRADTLPSVSQPNLLGQLATALDDDPRSWSPSELSTYLSSSLRVTSGDLPPLVAHDIAAFVRAEKITGRKFLRLTEGDLDNYGLNQRWQNALLRASRVLRQDSVRGRIWNTSFLSGEDDSYSSTSSSGSLNDVRRGRRPDTESGRVKGMVASFERSSSPTKSSSSTSSCRNMSPVKDDAAANLSDLTRPSRSRPRPQSDILPARHHTSFDPTVNLKDPEQKKERRLLPYPPSSASAQPNNGYGLYGHGPPPLLPQDTSPSMTPSFSAFPSGVLPFSPQSTGTVQIPSPDYHTPTQLPSFPADTSLNGARPLPFPPHSTQYYPSLAPTSYASDGIVYDKGDKDGENGLLGTAEMIPLPLPHGMMAHEPDDLSSMNIPRTTARVQVHVQEREHAVDDHHLTLLQPRSMAQQQQQQEQTRILDRGSQPLLHPFSTSPLSSSPPEILSPQPRHGSGRESPTKVWEEKLEELLEPRPRSRVISHSRVVSGGGGMTNSRPRSRVASLNLANGNGSLRGKKNGSRVGTPVIVKQGSNGSIRNCLSMDNANEGGDGENNNDVDGLVHQQPRTRVISISSRSHSHRLSGVEVWGETHPHYHHHHHHHHKKRHGIPFVGSDEEREEGVGVDGHGTLIGGGGGGEEVNVGMAKEEESSSEDGEIGNIETVLEKSAAMGVGYVKESSVGDATTTPSSTLSRTREPKSSVITVMERIPSEKEEEEEEEESMESLLAKWEEEKEGGGGGGGESVLRKGTTTVPLKGADAWEMLGNVDTVKRVGEGESMVSGSYNGRGVEDVFSVVGLGSSPLVEDVKEGSGGGLLGLGSEQTTWSSAPTSVATTPTKKMKKKLKPKSRKSESQSSSSPLICASGSTLTMDEEERELGRKMGETRRMVEDVRMRLEKVEMWIEGYEKRVEKRVEKRRRGRSGSESVSVSGLVMRMLKGFFSTWFGSYPSSPSHSTNNKTRTITAPQMNQQPLGRRMTNLGLNLSSYVVLVGIGMCVVVLRMLGRRPGVGWFGFGVGFGRMVGHGIMLDKGRG